MVLAIVLAVALGFFLLLMLARYAKDPAILRAEVADRVAERAAPRKPEVDPGRLRQLVGELSERMGLRVVEAESLGRSGASRLVAVGKGAVRDSRHIIYVEARPAGGVVDAVTLLALAEDVAHNDGSVGMVVTPGEIDRSASAGIDVDLELIDGAALLDLVDRHLPAHTDELRRYRLAGVSA